MPKFLNQLIKFTPFSIFSSGIFAAGGHHAPDPSAGFNWWGLGPQYAETPAFGWYTLTFFIFVGLLVHFVKTPLRDFLTARAEFIRSDIEEAKKAKLEAEKRLAQYRERLQNLDGEIRALRKDLAEQGKVEKVRIEAEAAKLSESIMQEAKSSIAGDLRHVKQTLKVDLAGWVLAMSQQQMQAGLSAENQDHLTKQFISDLRA